MKRKFLIVLLFCVSQIFSQKHKEILKLTLIPISDKEHIEDINLKPFLASNEITNKEYRNFIYDIISNKDPNLIYEIKDFFTPKIKPEEILPYLIDTLALSKEYIEGSKNYVKYKNYFTSKKYNNYPVVGVSYIGAYFYCRWLTSIEALKILSKKQNNKLSVVTYGVLIPKYRLPNEKEWDILFRFASVKHQKENIQTIRKTTADPNKKIKNINGNVSEWIYAIDNTNPITRGSSWKKNNNDDLVLDKTSSNGHIGFRVIKSAGK